MNKNQLASKIWASANKMRSKIEANEYKGCILGFIFYKFLSQQEVRFLLKLRFTPKDISEEITESHPENVDWLQNRIGYFIAYENLLKTANNKKATVFFGGVKKKKAYDLSK